MVDPVLAEDGNTYERSEIRRWLHTKSTSPLDPSCRLDASRLTCNRLAKQQIEELVASGELNEELRAAFFRRKVRPSLLLQKRLFVKFRKGKSVPPLTKSCAPPASLPPPQRSVAPPLTLRSCSTRATCRMQRSWGYRKRRA